ncbi:MAG: HAMP domain-containing sensor histidine kinase [Verrucomicrobiota bacterium]
MPDPSHKSSHWPTLFHTLGRAVFLVDSDCLTPLSEEVPHGIQSIFSELSFDSIDSEHPFLSAYLQEVEYFLKDGSGSYESSGPWVEESKDSKECYFEAQAFRLEGVSYLIIDDLGDRYLEHLTLIQKGRDNLLLNERLNREIQFREILYHCMAHDIRGPIAEIHLALDVLFSEGEWNEKQTKMRDIMQNSIDRQYQLIDDILLAFKEENHTGEPETLQNFDLLEISKESIQALQGQAAAAAVKLELEQALPEAPMVSLKNRSSISRVFYNLLSNAIRYSPKTETVVIKFSVGNHEVEVQVLDSGEGIQEGNEHQIFEKFVQNPGYKTGKIGLGLYYCRLVIEKLGGSIGARNRDNHSGACFWFKIPLAKVPG